MDTFPLLHAVPASWLRDSVLAPYVPAIGSTLLGEATPTTP